MDGSLFSEIEMDAVSAPAAAPLCAANSGKSSSISVTDTVNSCSAKLEVASVALMVTL